jgi:hypothetical protein
MCNSVGLCDYNREHREQCIETVGLCVWYIVYEGARKAEHKAKTKAKVCVLLKRELKNHTATIHRQSRHP